MKVFYKKSFIPSLILAFIFSLFLHLINTNLSRLPSTRPNGFSLQVIRFMFSYEGWVPFVIVFVFFAAIFYLIKIYLVEYPIVAAAHLLEEDRHVLEAAKKGSSQALEEALKNQLSGGQLGYYGTRLKLLFESFGGNQDISAVIALKSDLIGMDEEKVVRTFIPVTWVEATLPILGFLGTVLGIGQALGGIGAVVQGLIANEGSVSTLNASFSDGFSGMAIAFDTTFLGLAGLIIVGMLHVSLKKAFASRIAEDDKLFTEIISQWTSGGVGSVLLALKSLNKRLENVEGTLDSSRTMVERVVLNNPSFQMIKGILFQPTVEFEEVGDDLVIQTRYHINKMLNNDNWHFDEISIPQAGSSICVATVREPDKQDKLYFFEVDGDRQGAIFNSRYRFEKVFVSDDSDSLLAKTIDGNLVSINVKPEYDEQFIRHTVDMRDLKISGVGKIFQVFLEDKNLILAILQRANNFKVYWRDILDKNAQFLCDLPSGYDWSVWSEQSHLAKLFVAGKSIKDNSWQLMSISIRQNIISSKLYTEFEHLRIPIDIIPMQIIPFASDDLVILDIEGGLHYWDKNRSSPFMLSHKLWVKDRNCVISAGLNGWLAVAANNYLTMWRIKGGGVFYPFEDGKKFDISKIDTSTLCTTKDGRYLLGIADKNIMTWKFPRDSMD